MVFLELLDVLDSLLFLFLVLVLLLNLFLDLLLDLFLDLCLDLPLYLAVLISISSSNGGIGKFGFSLKLSPSLPASQSLNNCIS